MKKFITLAGFIVSFAIHAQKVKECNVYPSNIEENMWFESFDTKTKLIKNINFLVLSDGDNSQDVTPAFVVKLYLYQKDKEPIYIKTFELEGLYHMGSKEYKNINVSLKSLEIPEGTYRLGVHVNADISFKESESDNATLLKGNIVIGKPVTNTEEKTED
jgi:hypothetical protein